MLHNCDNRKLSSSAICDVRDIFLCGNRKYQRMVNERQWIRWLREKLEPRGQKTALARSLGLSNDKVTRMVATTGEIRQVAALEWNKIIEFFGEAPPGWAFSNQDVRSEDVAASLDGPRHVQGKPTIPLIAWVNAGKLADLHFETPEKRLHPVYVDDLGHGRFFATKVVGDSMDEISPQGSVIIVDRNDRQPMNGRYYIFSDEGATTYKEYRRGPPALLTPRSSNKTHDSKPMSRKIKVVGRVRRTILDL